MITSTLAYSVFLFFQDDLFNFPKIGKFILKNIKKCRKIIGLKELPPEFCSCFKIQILITKFFSDIPFSDLQEIFVFHLQDVNLLLIDIHDTKYRDLLWTDNFKDSLTSLFHLSMFFPTNICLPGMNVIVKSLVSVASVPLIIVNFHVLHLFVQRLEKLKRIDGKLWNDQLR